MKQRERERLIVEQCADITFAEPEDVPEVNETNCRNSTEPGQEIGFQLVYTTKENAAYRNLVVNPWLSVVLPVMLAGASWVTWF